MSRFVTDGGKVFPRELFTDLSYAPAGSCPFCGGMGRVPERLDNDRFDVMVPCHMCRMYCKTCKDWVKKKEHQCQR